MTMHCDEYYILTGKSFEIAEAEWAKRVGVFVEWTSLKERYGISHIRPDYSGRPRSFCLQEDRCKKGFKPWRHSHGCPAEFVIDRRTKIGKTLDAEIDTLPRMPDFQQVIRLVAPTVAGHLRMNGFILEGAAIGRYATPEIIYYVRIPRYFGDNLNIPDDFKAVSLKYIRELEAANKAKEGGYE